MPGSLNEPELGETEEASFRPLLFSIAYGMTGSVGDSEDLVQDAFLGMTRARQAGTVIASPKAYLTASVTRLGITYLNSARVRRETYVGDWLPEPVVAPLGEPGPAEHAELADSLSMAFLVLLEALSPVERAVFMLREVSAPASPETLEPAGRALACSANVCFCPNRGRGGGGLRRGGVLTPAFGDMQVTGIYDGDADSSQVGGSLPVWLVAVYSWNVTSRMWWMLRRTSARGPGGPGPAW